MKSYKVTVDGKVFNVDVEEVVGGSFNKESVDSQADSKKQEPITVKGQGGTEVIAPMPGVILNINVNVGNKVKAGDTIIILEAMKMENDIVAPCDGILKSVLVKKGDSVNSNDTLAIIE